MIKRRVHVLTLPLSSGSATSSKATDSSGATVSSCAESLVSLVASNVTSRFASALEVVKCGQTAALVGWVVNSDNLTSTAVVETVTEASSLSVEIAGTVYTSVLMLEEPVPLTVSDLNAAVAAGKLAVSACLQSGLLAPRS